MTVERIDDLVAVNVRAPMLLAHAAIPIMQQQDSGAVVLVSSIAGALLVPRESVYSATKAAVEAFAEPLREELRGSGITVSTVMPAVVATGFFDERGEPYARRFPRPQPPERAAAAVVRAVERGSDRIVVPPWFAVPLRIRGAAPRVYRALSRRFG
jgi:short-subunit dehydrogenase